MTLPELIAELEKAPGPSRELDAEIATISGRYVYERRGRDRFEWYYPTDGKGPRKSIYGLMSERLPDYTSSIDAARTLVPKGYEWSLEVDDDMARAKLGDPKLFLEGDHALPAIAICIAALRAIQAEKVTASAAADCPEANGSQERR